MKEIIIDVKTYFTKVFFGEILMRILFSFLKWLRKKKKSSKKFLPTIFR